MTTPLEQLRAALAQAERDHDRALTVYDGGRVVVEYDSDYYEGQMMAYYHAVKVLEEADSAT